MNGLCISAEYIKHSFKIMEKQNKGFDYRIVSYEHIHSIEESDFSALLQIIDPQPNQRIFEGCAGYGAVSHRIFDLTTGFPTRPELYILDESAAQIERARQLSSVKEENIIHADIRSCPFSNNFMDTAVVKMGIHELPFEGQKKAVQEIFRILKPGGRFVMWELALDHETQPIFQDLIRKKNELAGFEIINQNRYIQRLDELHLLYETAGFTRITNAHEISYTFESVKRYEELISKDKKLISEERQLDEADEIYLNTVAQMRLRLLNAYIRKRVPDSIKQRVKYTDSGENITLTIRKMIMVGTKPL